MGVQPNVVVDARFPRVGLSSTCGRARRRASLGSMRQFPTDPEIDPIVEAYKPGIDTTLIERNLRLTPSERLRQLMELQRFAEELRRGGDHARSNR